MMKGRWFPARADRPSSDGDPALRRRRSGEESQPNSEGWRNRDEAEEDQPCLQPEGQWSSPSHPLWTGG